MRQRLDQLLFNAGFFPSREKARAAIMAGEVRQGTVVLDKPGTKLKALPENLELRSKPGFASRGGLKLAGALQRFELDPSEQICLDIGASTGGFTDCLLQNGATKVYAIDVGYGQLDWRLRQDERVVCMEKCNARYLEPDDLYAANENWASLAVMDVSFISILKILPALHRNMDDSACLISLLKPQFEAQSKENRKGIVSSPKVHLSVLERIAEESPALGWHLHKAMPSPIYGKSGNREFLGVFYKHPGQDLDLKAIVEEKNEQPHSQNTK